jgi:hypothetical protein
MPNKFKTELTELLMLSRDALHIHVGLGIYVLAMLLLQRGPASVIPWFVVLAFELVNEFFDAFHGGHIDVDITGAARDVVNTMLWPTVALILTRWYFNRTARAA